MWLLDTNALIVCNKLKPKPFFKNYTFTTVFSIIEYPIISKLKELTVFYATTQHYTNAIKYASRLREKGTTIPTIDILISTITIDKKLELVSDDSDFDYFQAIEPKLNITSSKNYITKVKEIKE